jgi:hypothetical protein
VKLTRILEQVGSSAQYYDLGKDFFSFTHSMDTATEDVKNRFEQAISAKIKGKKIRARASRGYKQFEKDYEINVANVSLDDYYDNYVVVVKGGNGKEYFLKPGFKVQIIGPMEAEPQKQQEPQKTPAPAATQPPQPQPPSQAPAPAEPVTQSLQKEAETATEPAPASELVHPYPVEKILVDLQKWLPPLLANPAANLHRYIPREGVSRTKDRRTAISYGITIPVEEVPALTVEQIKHALSDVSQIASGINDIDSIYTLDKFDTRAGKYVIIIKKVTNY